MGLMARIARLRRDSAGAEGERPQFSSSRNWLSFLHQKKISQGPLATAIVILTLVITISLVSRFHTSPRALLAGLTAGEHESEILHPFQLHPNEHAFRSPGVIRQTWLITCDYRRPDGVLKEVYLINNVFPGPLVEARSGDQIIVEVENGLQDESVSIHWHGLSMRGSNRMDGAAGITQRSIAPGQKFTYDFMIEPSQHGTFFYHAHDGVQRADGLYGGFVVHEPMADTPVNRRIKSGYDEHVLLIGDWYHRPAKEALDFYMHPGSFGNEPVPDSVLVNGGGTFNCSDAVPARPLHCQQRQSDQSPILRLSTAKWTKLRLVNVGSYAGITLSASGFFIQSFAIDGGNEIAMATTQSVGPLQPGERLDIGMVPHRNNSLEGIFTLNLQMDDTGFKYSYPALTTNHQYVGEWVQSDFAGSQPHLDYEDKVPEHLDLSGITALSPLVPEKADIMLVLYAITQKLSHLKNEPHGMINNTFWEPQISPSLPLVDLPRDQWDEHQFVPHIPYNADSPSWVDVVLNNLDEESHPFHMHGYDFYVLSTYSSTINWGSYNPFEDAEPPGGKYNLERTVKRDTVLVPRRGYAVLRFRADNPGIWMFHCHVLWHQASGMAMAIDVS